MMGFLGPNKYDCVWSHTLHLRRRYRGWCPTGGWRRVPGRRVLVLSANVQRKPPHRGAGEPGAGHTHTGRAPRLTRDEHTVTDRESHDRTDPLTNKLTTDPTRTDRRTEKTRRPGHTRTTRCQSAATQKRRPQRTQPCPLPLPEHLPAYSPRLLEGGRVPNTGVPVWYRYSIGTPHRLAKNDKNRSVGRGVVVVVSLAPPLLARHGLRAPCPMLYCSRCRLGSQLPCTN